MCLTGSRGKSWAKAFLQMCLLYQTDTSSERTRHFNLLILVWSNANISTHTHVRPTNCRENARSLNALTNAQSGVEWEDEADGCWTHRRPLRRPDRQRMNDLWRKTELMMLGYLSSLTYSVFIHLLTLSLPLSLHHPSLTLSSRLLLSLFRYSLSHFLLCHYHHKLSLCVL